MKNILIFTGMNVVKYGAVEHYYVELASQLSKINLKPIFVYNNAVSKLENYANDLEENNAEWIVLDPTQSSIKLIKAIWKFFNIYKPYIVHTHFNTKVVRLVCYLSYIYRIPVRYNTYHYMGQSITIVTKIWMYSLNLLNTRQFAVSETIRKEQIKVFKASKNKIDTVRLGLNKKLFQIHATKEEIKAKYNLPKDGILIGNVAFHNRTKGIDVLLDAFKLVKQKVNVPVFLCQIGNTEDNYTPYLMKKVDELDIGKDIIWMEVQNNVPELLNAFDIYVQPSRSEGLGLAILEAYYAKLPVIGSNTGGIPEIVDNDKGFLFRNEDFNELANQLIILIESEKLRIKKGKLGFNFINKNYNLEKQVNALLTYY